jgi:hypothetical protein
MRYNLIIKSKGGVKMKKLVVLLLAVSVVIFIGSDELLARGNKAGPVIYVESQGLFYDAVVAADPLPMKGPFQLLYECEVGGITGLCTEFGPGDFGFYGGRWRVDDGNGIMDESDHFFSCPLLGPGRETP